MSEEFAHSVRIPSEGLCIAGLYPAFSEEYPEHELHHVLSRKEFFSDIGNINDMLASFWPCLCCQSIAVGCCLCTLGLSCLGAGVCVGDATYHTKRRIGIMNGEYASAGRRVRWVLNRNYCTSSLRVEYA